MSNPDFPCIPSNPDISGIGVRTAIYAQNLLSFAPAIYALLDKKVTEAELDSLEAQSTTILLTAFAILISTIVQALTLGLTNFHATIILNLSWMNNTNTFIYFLLYIHHKSRRAEQTESDGSGDELGRTRRQRSSRWINQTKKALRDMVLIIGSIHLSLMAAVGIWMWSQPTSFGGFPSCAMPPSVVILGKGIPLTSTGLRGWSIFIYALVLVPGLNLVMPMGGLATIYLVYNWAALRSTRRKLSIIPINIGLVLLAAINVIFLVDTELTIQRNAPLQEQGDSVWTFGQTLALLLLLVSLRDQVETFLERRQKKLDTIKQKEEKRVKDGATEEFVAALADTNLKWDQIQRWIERGADVNADIQGGRYGRYNTALLAAVAFQRVEIVELLLERGANVNTQGGRYGTALQAASASGHLDIVNLLLEHGANINIQSGRYGTALQAASVSGHLDVVEVLLKYGTNVNIQGGKFDTALQAASVSGQLDIVKILLKHGANVDIQGGRHGTALHAAARWGHLDIVKVLIENGADINIQGGKHGTVLQTASATENMDIVNFLLDHGANVDIQGGENGTPLQAASRWGYLEIVRVLIEHGADVNARGGKYGTALQAASRWGYLDIVNFLLDHGANVNIQGGEYGTALHAASRFGDLNIVKVLVESGTDANIMGKYASAVQTAKESGNQDVVKFLVEHGVQV